jgi:hypothetical protein
LSLAGASHRQFLTALFCQRAKKRSAPEGALAVVSSDRFSVHRLS